MADNFFKTTLALAALLSCAACQSGQAVRPAIVPGVEVRMPENKTAKPEPRPVKQPLKVIGEVEPVYFLPMKSPFLSRSDTGAETSSVDADHVVSFERDGEKWVAFNLVNRETGEKHRFEKKIKRQPTVKRINGSEERVVVMMDVRMGEEIVKAEFSLAARDRFNYQGLIGRNILTGRFVVDTSLANALR